VAVLLRLWGDAIAIADMSSEMRGTTSAIEVYGTEGWARGKDIWRGTGWVELSTGDRLMYESNDLTAPYVDQVIDFTEAIAGRSSIGTDGEAGLRAFSLTEAASRFDGAARPRKCIGPGSNSRQRSPSTSRRNRTV
jgi:predicted dehydrogenase